MQRLTLDQQRLVRSLVNRLKNTAAPIFYWNSVTGAITFPEDDGRETPSATQENLHCIEAAGFIKEQVSSYTETTGYTLEKAAILAMQSNFGRTKSALVLQAIYEASSGTREYGLTQSEMMTRTGLNVAEIHSAMDALHPPGRPSDDRIEMGGRLMPGSDPKDVRYRLTGKGIEEHEHTLAEVRHGNVINFGGDNRGNLVIGDGNIATVNNADNEELARRVAMMLADLTDGLSEHLPNELEAMRSDIEQIRQQVESGNPNKQKLSIAAKRLITELGGAVDWTLDRATKAGTAIEGLAKVVTILETLHQLMKAAGIS